MKQSRIAPSSATTRTSVEDPAPSQAPEAEPVVATSKPSLIFDGPDGPDTWLVAARGSLLDLLAAAREGARRPRQRVLSRAEIRRQAREAFAGASALLDEAAEALRAAAPFMTKPR
jgi:hypothetical protein